MKHLSVFIFTVVMFLSALCSAQEENIQKIKNRYQDVTEMILDEFLTPVSVTFAINRPAIGLQTTKILFYWNNMESEGYGDDGSGEVVYQIHREIYLITIEYNVAGSVFYHIEYLFDSNGDLIFYHSHTMNSGINEEMQYFSNQKLIMAIYKTFELNADGEAGNQLSNIEKNSGFDNEDRTLSVSVLENARRYLKQFNDLFEIEMKN